MTETKLHAIVHDDMTCTWWETDTNDVPLTPPKRTGLVWMPWTHDTVTISLEMGESVYRIGEDA